MRKNIVTLVAVVSVAVIAGLGAISASGQRFYPDDPISREPEPQDAGRAAVSEVDLMAGLTHNLFALEGRKPSGRRAQNVSTIDEVPDSSWFTNRIGTQPLTI